MTKHYALIERTHTFEWWVLIYKEGTTNRLLNESLHLVWGTRGMANRKARRAIRKADNPPHATPRETYTLRWEPGDD